MILRPTIFDGYPEITAALSLRDPSQPADFSIKHDGENDGELAQNRLALTSSLGYPVDHLAFPRLVHGDTIVTLSDDFTLVDRPDGDAIITDIPGWLIGVTVADCGTVLIYDPVKKVVAAIHSGWRGSIADITTKTIDKLKATYASAPADFVVFLGPTPHQHDYEVGPEVAEQFDAHYIDHRDDGTYWLDNQAVIYDQVRKAGVPIEQIERDPRSTMTDASLHSHRRDKDKAGRMIAAIALKAT